MTSRKQQIFLSAVDTMSAEVNNKQFAAMYKTAVRNHVVHKDPTLFQFLMQLERAPVGIEEFLDSPEFLGATDLTLWPEVRKALIEINCNWWRGLDYGAYNEAVLAGSTGTGKTSIAIVTTMYHLYLLSCMKNPQAWYGFPKATSIVFAIMGAKPRVVSKVIYLPMRKFIESIPYFQKHCMPDKMIESEMFFPEKNMRIAQSGGDEDAILGKPSSAA